MKIVNVEVQIAEKQLSVALTALAKESDAIRAMQGCLAYQTLADTQNSLTLMIVQRWQSAEDFGAYRNSPEFANLIQSLKPILTAPPVTFVATQDS